MIKLNRQNDGLRNMSYDENFKDIVREHLEAVENTLRGPSQFASGPHTDRSKTSTNPVKDESFAIF